MTYGTPRTQAATTMNRRGKAAENVSQAGNQADDAIQAEADGGAGDAKPLVEHVRQQIEIFVREQSRSPSETRRGRAS